jgi:hypothetical protein
MKLTTKSVLFLAEILQLFTLIMYSMLFSTHYLFLFYRFSLSFVRIECDLILLFLKYTYFLTDGVPSFFKMMLYNGIIYRR